MDEAGATLEGFDYPRLVRTALLGVVREVLARTASDGLPGEHQLYLTFGTADEGVRVPDRFRQQYPDEMTIVLQHQFWNLAVEDPGFGVTLRFGGKPERLFVPWASLRAFADPSVEFGFRLVARAAAADDDAAAEPVPATPLRSPATETAPAEAPKVVDLGAFRRKGGRPGD